MGAISIIDEDDDEEKVEDNLSELGKKENIKNSISDDLEEQPIKVVEKNQVEVQTFDNLIEEKNIQEEKVEVKMEKEELEVSEEAAKLAMLRAKSQAKQQEAKTTAKAKKEKSISIGFIGSGAAGGKISETAHQKFGYPAVAINSAASDLRSLSIPDSCKLLLEGTLGGAAKDRGVGLAVADANREKISELVEEKLSNCQVLCMTLSTAGGSGSGSVPVLTEVLAATGKPIICLCVLPLESDDVQSKQNSLEALSELAKYVDTKVISNLLLVDNAKLEQILSNVNQLEFYQIANEAVLEPLDMFNVLSTQSSPLPKVLDSAEFGKLLVSEGLSVLGCMEISNFEEDTAIAEAIISNLSNNLHATFDLKSARMVGFMITGSEKSWRKIPNSSLSYAASMVEDLCGTPQAIYKGFYVTPEDTDSIKVYSFFGGMGLPMKRIDSLKKQTEDKLKNVHVKNEQRSLNLTLDTGKDDNVSMATKIKQKIDAKKSNFNKLVVSPAVVDRRK